MIDGIQKNYRQPLRRTTVNKVQASAESQGRATRYSDVVPSAAHIAKPDRRKRRDRRKLESRARAIYDLRSGRGRRKGDRGRKVELNI